MRLGGPVYDYATPEQWVAAHEEAGYTAAYWPNVPEEQVDAYVAAAAEADLLIAEVGAWSNPLSPDPATREAALAKCIAQLALADRVGARCCVNIAGSLGPKWDGPCAEDLTPRAFEQIVSTVQQIIDAVQPTRTTYTLEPMPWMYPDSADSYLALFQAIDRPAFAAHFDPVNLVNSPARYFANADLLRECCAKLGPHIRSVHAKDILLADRLTVHLDEVPPGKGALDYAVLLQELAQLDPDLPVLLEHFRREDFPPAAHYIRTVAARVGVAIK